MLTGAAARGRRRRRRGGAGRHRTRWGPLAAPLEARIGGVRRVQKPNRGKWLKFPPELLVSEAGARRAVTDGALVCRQERAAAR